MAKGLIKLTLAYRGGAIAPLTEDVFVRTVVVPAEFSLAFLHEVIQLAFGWQNYHFYAFRKGNLSYTIPDADFAELNKNEREAARTSIGSIFKKTGDKCSYEYDFGDSNEVEVTHKGSVVEFDDKDFEVVGPNLIEDSAGFGYTQGIIELLTKKKCTAQAKECIKWLEEAFDLTPEEILEVPEASDIANRVWKLIDFVLNAIP